MGLKKLLLISQDQKFISEVTSQNKYCVDLNVVKNIHAGYSTALNILPEAILFDYNSLGRDKQKIFENFKSTHFLSRSQLFVYGKKNDKPEIDQLYRNKVDGIFLEHFCLGELSDKIDNLPGDPTSKISYWKNSFLGLFNLLSQPVILLQNEKIIEMNDAFKSYFLVSKPGKIKITDFVDCPNKYKVMDILRKFSCGKHMKASAKTSLLLKNNKIREASITFSKLDDAIRGQMVLMISFTNDHLPLKKEIGTASKETEAYFEKNNSSEALHFTKREKEVIQLLCKGYKTKEISEKLFISPKTIEKHRANIIKRTNSDTILESIIYALHHKIIEV